MPKVEIYTQPWCPYCSRAVALLEKKRVAFQEIDAPHGSMERKQAVARSGQNTMPQVFIDGRSVGGCDDLMALERAGRLDPMLATA